jgi:WD40 repeat protein
MRNLLRTDTPRCVHDEAFPAPVLSTEARNSKRLASGNTVWNARTGEKILTLKEHAHAGIACFSPDGQRLATAARNPNFAAGAASGDVKIWDARTGQELLALRKPKSQVFSACFSPDGQRLAVGTGNLNESGEVTVWDAEAGQELVALKGFPRPVTSICFSPDGPTRDAEAFGHIVSGFVVPRHRHSGSLLS